MHAPELLHCQGDESRDGNPCVFCQRPTYTGMYSNMGREPCAVRNAQRAAIEEIAAQRAAAAEGQRLAREIRLKVRDGHTNPPCSACDEMRGGLHTLESKGFVGQAQGAGLASGAFNTAQQLRAPGKQFARSEVLAILRSCRADAGNVADAEYARLINIFERME